MHSDTCCDTVSKMLCIGLVDGEETDSQQSYPTSDKADSCCSDHKDCPTDEIHLMLDEDCLIANTNEIKVPVTEALLPHDLLTSNQESDLFDTHLFSDAFEHETEDLYLVNSSFLLYG